MNLLKPPRWESHPDRQPLDLETHRQRSRAWLNGEAVEAVAIPVARIALPVPTNLYLRRQARKANFDVFYDKDIIQEGAHQKNWTPPKNLTPTMGSCLNALRDIALFDIQESNLTMLSVNGGAAELSEYQDNRFADSWHTDAAPDIPSDLTDIKYAVTLFGPVTKFAEGSFAANQIDDGGDALEPSYITPAAAFTVGTVTRFDGMTMHAGPKLAKPQPRLFMHVRVKIPDELMGFKPHELD
jgi:hypothetical protein